MQTTHSSSSLDAKATTVQNPIQNIDFISKLPDELLQTILMKLSVENAMRTSILSTRWVDMWKTRPDLVLNMGRILQAVPQDLESEVSERLAKEMTKVINNHRGDLESCILHHSHLQCYDGTLQNWVDIVTCVKHIHNLKLVNHGQNALRLYRGTFAHPALTSLSLSRYILMRPGAFNNCSNLRTLELLNILIAKVDVLNNVFEACSSLEVLVLHITLHNMSGVLKIMNDNLKFLQISCVDKIDKLEVYGASLDVLDIRKINCDKDDFILVAPNIQFNVNYWKIGCFPHISYNIAYLADQKKRNIWHKHIVRDLCDMISLSVSVDLCNPKEVEILKEVFLLWTNHEILNLEVSFKRNNVRREEGDFAINGRAQTKLWEKTKPFPKAVYLLWMFKLDTSNEEEFALALDFIARKIVIKRMIFETETLSMKSITDVGKLLALASKYNKDVLMEWYC